MQECVWLIAVEFDTFILLSYMVECLLRRPDPGLWRTVADCECEKIDAEEGAVKVYCVITREAVQ